MATPTRNTATPADESLLDLMAADHVSHMTQRVHELASQGDAKDRRQIVAPPPPPETYDESADAVGAFQSDNKIPTRTPTPIIVDLPLQISTVETPDELVEVEDVTYQPVPPAVEKPPPAPEPAPEPPPEKNLAEEILSQQMVEEMELQTPERLEAELLDEQDEFVDSILPAEESLEECEELEEEDVWQEDFPAVEEPLDAVVQQVITIPAPAPVRPRPTISAIRPPTQPSRVRSLLIQGLIVLLSLTAVGMVAYLMGILKL